MAFGGEVYSPIIICDGFGDGGKWIVNMCIVINIIKMASIFRWECYTFLSMFIKSQCDSYLLIKRAMIIYNSKYFIMMIL